MFNTEKYVLMVERIYHEQGRDADENPKGQSY
jgi:hypothetical protein